MTREEIKNAVSDEFIYLAISDAYSLIDKIYNDFEQQLKTAQTTIEAQEIVIADTRKRIEELETQRFELWMLLDNIDTAEDIAKSNDKLFRGLCRNEYKNRWSVYEPKEEQ